MLTEPNWTLLAKYLTQECSTKEMVEVERWLTSAPENRQWLNRMERVWNARESSGRTVDIRLLWQDMQQLIHAKSEKRDIHAERPMPTWIPTKIFWVRSLRIAALFLIVLGISYWGSRMIFPTFNVVEAPYGQKRTFLLSDGSEVILAAGSRLEYPASFKDHTREVILNGEGFFKIKSDPQYPFRIHAGQARIQVLGTQFNVKTWKAREVEVAVSEGQVSFAASHNPESAVILTQNQGSRLDSIGQPLSAYMVNIDEISGWQNNNFSFIGTPLRQILDQLERSYDIRFETQSTVSPEETITLHIQNPSLPELIRMLALATGYDVMEKKPGVYVLK